MDKLVLIDGNSLLNRAFYATSLFTTKDGTPTNAIFGFTKLLLKILDTLKPEYIVVAFDKKPPTFRHNMYPQYKATRKPMPEELAVQLEPLKSLLSAMKIATCAIDGIEADDILGTLSKKFDVHSYIYTGDRDSYQLVDDRTDVMFTKTGVSNILQLNVDNFTAETGVVPSQIIDLKALMGDKSDNIPGIPGVGEKTARELLQKYFDLNGVYGHTDELKGALKEKVLANRELAYLSYRLATINRDCDIDLDLKDCAAPKKFNSEVRKIFGDLEFKSLLGLDIFEDSVTAEEAGVNYPPKIICSSYEDIRPAIEANNYFTLVLEPNSIEIYVDGKQYSATMQVNLQDAAVWFDDYNAILTSIFGNEKNTVLTYDFKSAIYRLKEFGIEAKCGFDDLAIAVYLADNNAANLNLKDLCAYYLYDYAYNAFAVKLLFDKNMDILKSEGIATLYSDIEKPLATVLYEMEKEGVKISREMLFDLTEKYRAYVAEYEEKIYAACGKRFNLKSPVQLGEVLYTKFGLTEVKKKKTNKYTTGAEILEKLVEKAPVVGDILKYRQYQKLLSTYCEGILPLIDPKTGLIHTTYNQTLTSTGRLSSSNPNLQNIPVREEEGKELRKMFVPRAGNIFIDADYSQIELRLLAHFSGCKELVEAYKSGADIHSITAAQVFGIKPEEVTPQMRRAAKAVNFGIIYGISEFGLSKNLNIPVSTAREYIKTYFEKYSAVKDYMNKNVEFAREHGYVSTLTGRKRIIPEIKSENYNLRQFGERAAMNMPLQGSSADIIKIAMINVRNALNASGLKAKLILQVHDELILEAPEEEAEAASAILKYEMENAVKLNVPLTVELHTGKNWYDAK